MNSMDDYDAFPERLSSIFEAEKERLRAEIKRATGGYDHGGLTGISGERIAKGLIRRYLPSQYGFAKGEIMDSEGETSREVDIAVCNPSHPMTYRQDGHGLFFIETVDAVIEIKTTIQDINSLMEKCKSVRNRVVSYRQEDSISIDMLDRIEYTPYAVFAYDSDLSIDTIRERLGEQANNNTFIDILFVLEDGLVAHNRRTSNFHTDNIHLPNSDDNSYSINPYKPDLLMFLLLLYDKMPDIDAPYNPLAAYFDDEYRITRN